MNESTHIPADLLESARRLLKAYSNYKDGSFHVHTDAELELATGDIRTLKEQVDHLEIARTAITRPINEQLRDINAEFKALTVELVVLLNNAKRETLDYTDRMRRRAAEEARKAQEAADRREAKLRKDAEAAREAGKDARADILEERADVVAPAPVAPPPKLAGISERVTYSMKIVDAKAVPREWCIPDEKELNAAARALKDKFNIPGCRLVKNTGMAVRR